jgi:hypothetical protein
MQGAAPELHAGCAKQIEEKGKQNAEAAEHGHNVHEQENENAEPCHGWSLE